jgi:hypothetical protein
VKINHLAECREGPVVFRRGVSHYTLHHTFRNAAQTLSTVQTEPVLGSGGSRNGVRTVLRKISGKLYLTALGLNSFNSLHNTCFNILYCMELSQYYASCHYLFWCTAVTNVTDCNISNHRRNQTKTSNQMSNICFLQLFPFIWWWQSPTVRRGCQQDQTPPSWIIVRGCLG